MSSTAGPGPTVPETEALLQRVSSMISGARPFPLSSSVKLDNKDEVLELLKEAIERLPDELRQARWMLKEREEFLAATQRKADELVEAARSEAQRLVQRTEIAKEAQAQARRTVEDARDEARRLRLEAEDYADQKLAQFEIVLERTMKTVSSGRQKLSGLPERDTDLSAAFADGPLPPGAANGPSPAAGGSTGDKRRHGRHAARSAESGELPGPADIGLDGPDAGGRADEGLFDQDRWG